MPTLCPTAGDVNGEYWHRPDTVNGTNGTTSAAPPIIASRHDYCGCGGSGSRHRDVYVEFHEKPAMLEIRVDDQPLAFPLLVLLSYRDGYFEIEHREFGLFGCGRTQEEAVEDLVSFLLADREQYAEAPDDELDPAARDLAGRYRRLFGIQL